MKRTANLIVQHLLWRGLYFFSVLILNVLISRLFAAEKSGQIFYIVNNLSFVLLLVSMSLESAAVYFVSSGKLDGLQMARFCVLWIGFSMAIAASGWWLSLRLTNSIFYGDAIFLYASLLFIAGALMTTFFSALFYAKQKFGLPNKVLFIINGCLILLLIFKNSSGWTRNYFLMLYFFCYFLQGLALLIIFFVWYPEKKKSGLPPLPVLTQALRYASAAVTANIIYFLVNRIDYWFVKYYCSAQDLGNYIQASKLAQMLLVVPSILGATLFPIIASGKEKSTLVPVAPVVRVLFWINVGICVPLILIGYWAFPFVFGISFLGMYPLFLLLIPGLLCLTANYPLTSWNSGKNRVRRNIKGSIIALIIIIAGDSTILPHYGVRAAALMSSIGYFCYYCHVLFYYRREQSSDLSDFFVLKKADFSWILFQINRLTGKYTRQGEIKLPKQG